MDDNPVVKHQLCIIWLGSSSSVEGHKNKTKMCCVVFLTRPKVIKVLHALG